MAERLYPGKYSKSSTSFKYKLDCIEILKDTLQSTNEWLAIVNNIAAHQNQNRHVVIKIGQVDAEYIIGQQLHTCNLETLLSFIGIETSNNNNSNNNNNNSILVLPFLKHGSIQEFKGSRDNIHIYKNLLKHVVCTLLYAFETCGFNHSSVHMNNILLKKTTRENIQYGDRITIPIIGDFIPVLMDYERSSFSNSLTILYQDIGRFFNFAGMEIDVNLNLDKSILDMYIVNQIAVTKQTYVDFCNHIETREIEYVLSEMLKQNTTKNAAANNNCI